MKKIKFIVCFLSAFFLFNCNVNAQELTCIYEGGWYNDATKLVQTAEGNHFVYTNFKKNKPSNDDVNWKKQDNTINFEETGFYDKNSGLLTACPAYTRNGFNNNSDFTFYFYDEKTWHLDYKFYDSDDIVLDDSNITQSFTEEDDYSTEIANTNWIGICSYEDVTLYFNRKKIILDNKSDLIYRSETGFSLNELLEYYDLADGCPILYQEINNASVGNVGNYNVTYYLYDKNNRLYEEPFIKDESSINDDNKVEEPTINIEDCLDLFSPEFIKKLNSVFVYIRIFVPILLVGLGVLDFAKAMFSSSEDEMKKAQSKFVRRVIAAVIVFLIPTLVNLLLSIANSIWNNIDPNSCNIG